MATKSPHDYLFATSRGTPLDLSNWRRQAFDPAVVAADLDRLTPYDLRHTAASLAVAAGANVKGIQRMLGHASAAMTLDIYAGLFEDDLDRVGQRIGDAAAAELADSAGPKGTVVPLPRPSDSEISAS